jgi:hypothetical protein
VSSPREDGWTGVDVNGAGIDMYPVPAARMMSDLAKILTDARDGWAGTEGRITALEGKLGDGPLGKKAMEQYRPAAKQLREVIDDMIENFGKLSDAGTKAVPTYVTSDQQAGQHFGF